MSQVVALPIGVPFEVGASIGIPLMTAYHAVQSCGPLLGRTVVVPQAATFEIQELLYVFTVDPEDRVRATRITTRARLDDARRDALALQADGRFEEALGIARRASMSAEAVR